ncbi:MAG: rhodanese-like domain-containing protein [Sinobacterium sp.]|nr:rhodanese-like domain-containing protein [Sinobacterium sp.]
MLKSIPEIVQSIRSDIPCITIEQALATIQAHGGVLIDVREPAEYADNSHTSAINIPRGLLEMKMLNLYNDAELAVYVHCATGARASFAAEQLIRVGYKNVSIVTCDLNTICAA